MCQKGCPLASPGNGFHLGRLCLSISGGLCSLGCSLPPVKPVVLSAQERAQAGFACPNAGTVEFTMIIREFYEGVDPDDPVICMGTDSFPRFARLNNWYNDP